MRNEVSVKTHLTGSTARHPAQRRRIASLPTRPFFILIGVVLLIAALWSYMAVTANTHVTLDQHVHNIGEQLKCPVCQGESVADSTSDRAQEMRAVIRQQILAGQSDQQVIQYFSDRYGTQIVWSPPWWGFSLLAWLVPIALLLGGFVCIFFTLRDWSIPLAYATVGTDDSVALPDDTSPEEDAALADLDEEEMANYRAQLERELAEEDALFERTSHEKKETETAL